MQIGVPKEVIAGETRVAASPKSVEQLLKLGFDVAIEKGVLKKPASTTQRLKHQEQRLSPKHRFGSQILSLRLTLLLLMAQKMKSI